MTNQLQCIVVDSANVVGARPNGWWKDRAGATARFQGALARLATTQASEIDSSTGLEAPTVHWHLVVEGAARDIAELAPIALHRAPGSGDDMIAQLSHKLAHDADVVVVTNDRELRTRLPADARVQGAGWLWALIDNYADPSGHRPQ